MALRPRFWIPLAVVLLGAACERPRDVVPVDTVGPPPVTPPDVEPGPEALWDRALGPMLLVSGELPEDAWVVPPGHIGVLPRQGARITLYNRAAAVQVAIAHHAEAPPDACPMLRLEPAGQGSLIPWTVGFVGAELRPLPLDSIEGMSRADSSRLAVQVTRLASTLPGSADEGFGGLPFRVFWLWRFTIPGGPEVIVAGLIRQIAMEAAPAEERTLLIAERAGTGAYTAAYYERSRGAEETIESREVLAAGMLGAPPMPAPAIFLVRDYGDSVAYSVLQRGADGQWHPGWISPRRAC